MSDVWAPYKPDSTKPWTAARAAHLLRRAGFAASHSELQIALADGPQKTVDRLVTPPASLPEFDRRLEALGSAVSVSESNNSDECATLWLHRIAATPYPLLEKMTLFWHDHFAIAGARAGKAMLIEQHLRLLRRHALGRFDAMLAEIVTDPATLLASGARLAPKAKPPAAFASSLLGRWTLGPGAAGRNDVLDAARSLTGASVLRDRYHFQPADHDNGTKRILGQEGNFSAAEVARIAADHAATPRHLTRRIYRWLVNEMTGPEPNLIEPLAATFARDFDTGKLVERILRSDLFFSESVMLQRVRSPLEFALGIVKAVDASPAPAVLHRELSALGQRLLEPPTRDGWAGGHRWLNEYTMIRRANLAASLVAAKPLRDDPRFWWNLLLQREPAASPSLQGREAVLKIVTMAEFQRV